MAWPKIVTETWACHEALRRLGFTSAELFVVPENAGDVFVSVHAQGKTFNLRVGPRAMPEDKFIALWRAFVQELRTCPDNQLLAIFHSSAVYRQRVEFTNVIVAHGFRVRGGN